MSTKEQSATQLESSTQETSTPPSDCNLNSDALTKSLVSVPDVQVKAGQTAPRRKFTVAYKLKTLNQFDACPTSLDRGELLRQEGLYHARICTWRKQRDAGKLNSNTQNKPSKSILTNQKLARDNTRLKKQLARATAIIDIQKKVSDLFGIDAIVTNDSEINS